LFVQACGVPHCPTALHVAMPLLMHSVAPGVQTPWHDAVMPLTTHAWFVQLTAVPHMPLLPQVCTAAFPEHCVAPGVHDPVHTPPEHTELVHATGDPQVPVALQVSTLFAAVVEHRVAPGLHDPVHAPPTHAWFEHGCGVPH
jgi:hypothetical protein